MIVQYIQEAMSTAKYEILEDDGSFYAEVPLCKGVYANAESLENCRSKLEIVLEEWILLRIHKNLEIPKINNIKIKVIEEAVA